MPLRTATHCPYCSLQCAMNLVSHDEPVTIEARNFPTNKGGLCQKGWTAADLLSHPDRLTQPLLHDCKNAALRPASWDEALHFLSTCISEIQQQYGRDAVGVFGGGGLTNEKAYLLGKFARA